MGKEKALKHMPIATETDKLDSEHYEMPTSFLKLVLGKNLKYSCCYFTNNLKKIDDAEKAMLELYCERAQIKDGQSILDIGCGTGSLLVHIAQNYKGCRLTGLTNSIAQKGYIEEQCRNLNISNIEVIVEDISEFKSGETFDRIMIIELFEHMKNYHELLKMISQWMKKDGFLFLEHLCHKEFPYFYKAIDEEDWLSEYVFPEGTFTLPSASLLYYFQEDVSIVDQWLLSGNHFARTGMEWLRRMDENSESLKPILESLYGSKEAATKWTAYWRASFIILAEQFSFSNGQEWMTSHILFKKKTN